VARNADGRTLLQRLCRAAGVEESGEDASLEALIARLGDERRRRAPAPVLVLDGVAAATPLPPGLATLLGASVWSRSFKVVLSGAPGLAAKAAAAPELSGETVPEISVGPLDRAQLARYLRGWLEATLAPGAAPVLVSPDALLLAALRSEGLVERVDCIARNMLTLAAAERRRTLTSWHAWSAPERERWAENAGGLPVRPRAWPPAEVVEVLDACRRAAGMPPWPRATPKRSKGESR
jgi:hypothetical protein